MASWIGASPAQRYHQYIKPAAVAALDRGDHETIRQDILKQVAALGDRPAEEGVAQRQWDRRIARLRQDYSANQRQERRDLWLAGRGPMPAEVRREFQESGQRVPAYLER